jgi:hypothetical protein
VVAFPGEDPAAAAVIRGGDPDQEPVALVVARDEQVAQQVPRGAVRPRERHVVLRRGRPVLRVRRVDLADLPLRAVLDRHAGGEDELREEVPVQVGDGPGGAIEVDRRLQQRVERQVGAVGGANLVRDEVQDPAGLEQPVVRVDHHGVPRVQRRLSGLPGGGVDRIGEPDLGVDHGRVRHAPGVDLVADVDPFERARDALEPDRSLIGNGGRQLGWAPDADT